MFARDANILRAARLAGARKVSATRDAEPQRPKKNGLNAHLLTGGRT
jgi:hypothetical protein